MGRVSGLEPKGEDKGFMQNFRKYSPNLSENMGISGL
jgi:hypothetical protein